MDESIKKTIERYKQDFIKTRERIYEEVMQIKSSGDTKDDRYNNLLESYQESIKLEKQLIRRLKRISKQKDEYGWYELKLQK